jgi:sulfoquinovose isomerase
LIPAASTWSGKPDLYHSYQALLFPSLPLSPTAATALARRGSAAGLSRATRRRR